MANGLNTFFHDSDASERTTIKVLRSLFHNDGYAFWFITLEVLSGSENMQINCKNRKEWLEYVAKCGVSEETAAEILNILADLGAIDKKLWKDSKIIWTDALVNRLKSKLIRRRSGIPDKPEVREPSKKSTSEKIKFSEYVSMKQSEYDKLVKDYGKSAADEFISTLDNYKGYSGKSYKDDYRAILSWVIKSVKEKKPELFQSNGISDFSDFDIPKEFEDWSNGYGNK